MARPKILVFQHVPYEPLGTLDPLLKAAGFRIRYVNFGRDADAAISLGGYDGLIVLGGPMHANDTQHYPNLAREVDAIRDALAKEKAVLGICLGAQLLALAIGGQVNAGGAREIGWFDVELTGHGRKDSVLGAFEPRQRVFQWHVDTIGLPAEGCVHLASSQAADVQAFRCGPSAYGFQFHLEVNRPLVERWLRVPANQAALNSGPQPVDTDALRSETDRRIDALEGLSHAVFGEWVQRFELPPSRMTLPSR